MQEFLDFAQSLQVAMKALQLYTSDHPRALEAMTQLNHSAEILFAQRDRLQIVASQDRLFIERKPIARVTPHTQALLRQINERKINGFVISRGVTSRDLEGLVRILIAKPNKVEELGGFGQMLGDANISSIRVSHVRYEELREGEEIVDNYGGGRFSANTEGREQKNIDYASLINDVFRPLMTGLRSMARTADGTIPVPGLAVRSDGAPLTSEDDISTRQTLADPRLAPALDLQGIESRFLSAGAFEQSDFAQSLSETILELDPDMQSRLLSSRASLPEGPMRDILDNLAPSFVLNIVAALAEKDFSTSGSFPEIVSYLYSQLPAGDRSLERLKARLDNLGIDHDQLEELLEILTWETLRIDEKVHWVLEGRRLYEVPPERILTFFRDLVVQKRHDDFVMLVERYGLALQADSAEIRRGVLENFVRIALWSRDPGLLPAEETVLQRILFTHFLREQDSRLQQRSVDALSNFIGTWMLNGRTDKALRALNNLQAGMAAAAAALPWKNQAYESLSAQLSREHVRTMTRQLYSRDHELVAADLYPLLALLGAPAASELVDELAAEDDRANRGRIIRAVKAIGKPALLPLRHSLNSSTWFVVRNTLNLLGDLGAVELVDEVGATLNHADQRVRRAAARALAKIGGEQAETLLVLALPRADAEVQGEILFSLAGMKAEGAVSALGELVKSRRMGGADEATRERAVETLGQIGSARGIPILEELLLKKRTLLGAGESTEMRVAAARALSQIAAPEAKLVIQKAVESESSSSVRDQMEKLLHQSGGTLNAER